MRLECEKLEECEATPELIREARYEWEKVSGYGSSDGASRGKNSSSLVKKLLYIVPLAFALAYVGHAAYLWKQYGPPTGFCTKCFIYWGKHRILGGNTHWCEHAPLHWSVSGNKQEE